MMRRTVAVSAAVMVLAGCTAATAPPSASPTPQPARFERAATNCGMTAHLADNKRTLLFDTKGKDDGAGDDMDDVACVLRLLLVPASVVSHLDSTRALDGQQTDSWDGINARWTYHPDSGLTLTLVDTER